MYRLWCWHNRCNKSDERGLLSYLQTASPFGFLCYIHLKGFNACQEIREYGIVHYTLNITA